MNNKKTIKIGVLGGIGPEATGEFYNKLIIRLQEKGLIKRNKDFPQIVINSIPAPELIYEEIISKNIKPYLDGLKELDCFRVSFIVMVCNTIHLFRNALQKQIRANILDLKEELRKSLNKKKASQVLIFGTPITVKKGLFRFKNITSFEPTDEELKHIANAVFNYNKGENKQKQKEIVKRICQKYTKKGADAVILGCTELSLMLADEKINSINTIDVLVEATIKRFMNEKRKTR